MSCITICICRDWIRTQVLYVDVTHDVGMIVMKRDWISMYKSFRSWDFGIHTLPKFEFFFKGHWQWTTSITKSFGVTRFRFVPLLKAKVTFEAYILSRHSSLLDDINICIYIIIFWSWTCGQFKTCVCNPNSIYVMSTLLQKMSVISSELLK